MWTTGLRKRKLKASVTVSDPRKLESRISSAEEKKSAIKTPDKLPEAIVETLKEQAISERSSKVTDQANAEEESNWMEKLREMEEFIAL